MKKIVLIVIAVVVFNIAALAQEVFYGEWHMQEFAKETLEEKVAISSEELKAEGTFWIMKFSEGKFYQSSNYNARGETVEMEGTWKTEPNERLTIFILRDGQKLPLKFFYEFKGDKMILERYDQLRTVKMVVVFKKV